MRKREQVLVRMPERMYKFIDANKKCISQSILKRTGERVPLNSVAKLLYHAMAITGEDMYQQYEDAATKGIDPKQVDLKYMPLAKQAYDKYHEFVKASQHRVKAVNIPMNRVAMLALAKCVQLLLDPVLTIDAMQSRKITKSEKYSIAVLFAVYHIMQGCAGTNAKKASNRQTIEHTDARSEITESMTEPTNSPQKQRKYLLKLTMIIDPSSARVVRATFEKVLPE